MNPPARKTGPAYRIVSPRLLIRCWDPSDASKIGVAIKESLDHLRPWLPWADSWPLSYRRRVELLRKWRGNFDLGIDFVYGIFNPDESMVLGGTGLHTRLGEEAREIGYWIHKDYTNQGYATEVAAALTKVAFEIDHVSRVEIHCNPKNVRSASIPHKLGYIHEATLSRRVEDIDGKLRDVMVWSLFADDYSKSLPKQLNIHVFDVVGKQIL